MAELEEDPSAPSAPSSPYHGTEPWMHNVCIAAAVLAPVGLALPPRRMGARSLLLAAGAFFATSQLTYDYTGRSLFERFAFRAGQVTAVELPEGAVRRQAAMRAERERRAAAAAAAAAGDAQEQGRLHKIWMGNEKEDWARERARREKEVLESGGGYWELIMEQISDVWTDLRKKDGGDKKTEEKPETKTETSEPKR